MLDSVFGRNGLAFARLWACRMFCICAIRFNLTLGSHKIITSTLLTMRITTSLDKYEKVGVFNQGRSWDDSGA
ncbi:MAG: hypothetical protein K9K34_16765, partial [Desulfarculaceae bacterium]|nr:hypothetical protein [Desulfarculaceae bacterium]